MNKVISHTGIRKLEDMWLSCWHERPDKYTGGNAERWFNIVVDFLSARGDELMPRELRDREIRVIQAGRSKEYLAALAEIVDFSPEHNEYDQTVLVVTATPEERAAALEKVMGII